VLAAFAVLRCGEIGRLSGEDLTLSAAQPVALIHGKGGCERVVPLLPPVVAELRATVRGRGPVVLTPDGKPFTPDWLTNASSRFMKAVSVQSTLHSVRHYFASTIAQMTKDVLLVKDLLGNSSLQTTQIYGRASTAPNIASPSSPATRKRSSPTVRKDRWSTHAAPVDLAGAAL
jgi:integrase